MPQLELSKYYPEFKKSNTMVYIYVFGSIYVESSKKAAEEPENDK